MPAGRARTIVCEVGSCEAELETIDALARLDLAARRLGLQLRLRHVSSELEQLLTLAGLRDVLRVETGRETEEREQRVGVEEEGDLGDPSP